MKILAIKLRAMGDTVLMSAPLTELRAAFPEARIDALVPTAWAPLLENHPALERIWARRAGLGSTLTLAVALRREHYDCVVCFHASPSSAMLARATGAKVRAIHFHGHEDANRFSTVEIPGKGTLKPIIERDMDAVRALGVHVPAGRLPRLLLTAAETRMQERAMNSIPGPVLGLGLGASRPAKSWPIERFARLAVSWAKSTGGAAVGFAGPGEESVARAFLSAIDETAAPEVRGKVTAETGTDLRVFMGRLGGLSAFAGNDSGPRHLAAALGVPTVTVFGPEDPFEWHPYPLDRHPRLFVENLACRRDAAPGMPPWCGIRDCVIEGHVCMTRIGVDAVLAECLRVAVA